MKAIEQAYTIYDEVKEETGIDPRNAYSPASLAVVETDYNYRVSRAELKVLGEMPSE